jgi:hypothetical protein
MSYYNYFKDFIFYYLPDSIKYYYINTDTIENFYYSLEYKNQEIVDSYLDAEDLLKLGKSVNHDLLPNLRTANQSGKYHIFKFLTETTGVLLTEYEMLVAVQSGSLEILKYIINSGIVPHHYLLDEAIKIGHSDTVKYLISIGLRSYETHEKISPEILEILKKFFE